MTKWSLANWINVSFCVSKSESGCHDFDSSCDRITKRHSFLLMTKNDAVTSNCQK